MEEKKREFKAVAMRFTQEEFEKMDKTGMTVYRVCGFNTYPYLINQVGDGKYNKENKENKGKLLVTNSCGPFLKNKRTIIETCDPELFRQFCGLENSIDESKESTSNNKREFRAIAMRCSQEDFDKMDKTGLDFIHIGNFLHQNYLVNDYHEKQRLVSNVMHVGDCSVLEFWNEDIFRICSGLEPKSKKRVDKKGVILGIKVKDDFSKEVEEIKERMKKYETHLNRGVSFSTPFFEHIFDKLSEYEKEKHEYVKRKPFIEAEEQKVKDWMDILSGNHILNFGNAKEEPKTFKTSDIQFLGGNGEWADISYNATVRFKPKPTPEESLSAEIESLSKKAKELGLKATVLFEKS